MRSLTRHLTAVAALLLGVGASHAAANDKDYVRLERGSAPEHAALQTAVAHFRAPGSGVEIVLYGVVHVAEADYYARVQRDLDSYTTVLFEGVAPGKEAPTEADNSLGDLQMAMGDLLGLTFQKDGIDYTRKNLVHADMNMDQLKEHLGGGTISPMGQVMSEDQLKKMAPMIKMIAGMGKVFMQGNPRMRDQLKLQMATQLSQADLSKGLGEKMTQVILIERNKVVMEVLERQLAAQKDGSIAIFYGAAHMPDLEERLAALGFQRTSMRWMSAWKVGEGVEDGWQAPATAGAPKPAPRAAEPVPAGAPATTPSGARWF